MIRPKERYKVMTLAFIMDLPTARTAVWVGFFTSFFIPCLAGWVHQDEEACRKYMGGIMK